MALWTGFIGETYQALSPSIAAETAINLFAEVRGDGSAKQVTFYGTPGLVRETDLAGPCRGKFTQDGRSWTVNGGTLYERAGPATYVALGPIPDDGKPVFFASNGEGGDQLGIAGGGQITVLDLVTGALAAAVLPFSDPVMLVFLDGYALANQADSLLVWYSAIEDMTDWDALDFFTRSGTSDNIVGIGVRRDRVKVFGSKTITDYYNSGDADTPFLPYPSTTVQGGLISPALLQNYADVFYLVGETPKGARQVMAVADGPPQVISTPPIELFLSRCTTLADASTLFYEQGSHPFFVLTCPSSPEPVQTYHFDSSQPAGFQWQARAGWNSTTGVYTRWRAQGATVVHGEVLVGDYDTGATYTLDLDAYDDDGEILKRERTAPYFSASDQWLFIYQLSLGTQAGVGLSSGQGSEPVVNLEISRDAAKTWRSAGAAPLGAIGEFGTRTKWGPLGRALESRWGIRITQTDPVKTVWGPGLYFRSEPGTGQL